ncbi:RDD family protein [Steroidobacter sp. S1-65]|uniref:RDD family protein n=1 Tax=Steroidobacter gossypii TaxID=2805490 RepID=A0ABS1X6F3_9GAMM|nr:RDD family protein [Steroidobacter gossypii]MBM0108812.1 RDD family protein [Steroidobacter gossypii]
MKRLFHKWLLIAMLAGIGGAHLAMAQEPPAPPAPPAEPAEPQLEVERDESVERTTRHRDRHQHEYVIVHVGDDSRLPAGEYAHSVVSIFGSASSAGEVEEAVVAILGNASATGPVGDAVVAIFGDVYVDAEVGHDVVAMMGNVKLGPNAVVHGELVSVGGAITRDPAAVVHGPQQQISFGQHFGRLEWLKPWFESALLYGRPLAFESSLGWAWWLAAGFLALYVVLALMFDQGMQRCVTTLEEKPAQTVLASVLAVLFTPVLIMILAVTVIGIPILPFLLLGLFCAGLFGKAAVLATIGRRITRFTGIAPFSHVAFATLIGGLIVLLLYVVPVFGFIVFNLIGVLGLGVVVYTLMLAMRSNHAPVAAPAASMPGAPGVVSEGVVGDGTVPPSSQAPSPPRPSNVELAAQPRAGFWIRAGALALDALLVILIVNVLEPADDFFALLLATYGAVMWKLRGTTIGGIICNLRVVRTDGQEIGWETAIVRALGCFLSFIPLGLGFIWMVFDNNRQTWHDKIAGTVVVRVPRSQPLT